MRNNFYFKYFSLINVEMDLRIKLDKMIEKLYVSNYENKQKLVNLANLLGINSYYNRNLPPLYIAFNIRGHLAWSPIVYSDAIVKEACVLIDKIIDEI